MKYLHKCQCCGKEFTSKKKTTKFCSITCGNHYDRVRRKPNEVQNH